MEGRIDEIAAKQNYTDDDFYLDCSLSYTSLGFTKEQLTSEEQTVLDVLGYGAISGIYAAAGIKYNVYIDDVLYFWTDSTTSNSTVRFGAYSLSSNSSFKITDMYGGNLSSTSAKYFYFGAVPIFKEKLRVTVTSNYTGTNTGNIFSVNYGFRR